MNTHECNNNTADLSTNTTRKEIRLPRILKINSRFLFSFSFSFFFEFINSSLLKNLHDPGTIFTEITEVTHLHTRFSSRTRRRNKTEPVVRFAVNTINRVDRWDRVCSRSHRSRRCIFGFNVLIFENIPGAHGICSFVNDEVILPRFSIKINVKYVPGGSEYCSKAVNLQYSICSVLFLKWRENDVSVLF